MIDLQAAHMTQYTSNGANKTDWYVRKNITSENLFTLPRKLTDTEAQAVLDNAKKYELIAFNAGIKFQKTKQNEVLLAQIADLKHALKGLADENERLTSILETLLPSEE